MANEETKKRRTKADGLVVKVKVLDPKASIPAFQTKGAACFDIAILENIFIANTKAYVTLPLVRTGLAFDIPEGYHMEVYIRSGIGRNTKIRLANQVGIIDSDYKDELFLVLENLGIPVHIKAGTRIAQARIVKNENVVLQETKSMPKSTHGGFGSTGA